MVKDLKSFLRSGPVGLQRYLQWSGFCCCFQNQLCSIVLCVSLVDRRSLRSQPAHHVWSHLGERGSTKPGGDLTMIRKQKRSCDRKERMTWDERRNDEIGIGWRQVGQMVMPFTVSRKLRRVEGTSRCQGRCQVPWCCNCSATQQLAPRRGLQRRRCQTEKPEPPVAWAQWLWPRWLWQKHKKGWPVECKGPSWLINVTKQISET